MGINCKKTFSTPKITELQHVCYAAKKSSQNYNGNFLHLIIYGIVH